LLLNFVDKPEIANMIKQSQERRARVPRYEEYVNKMERRASFMELRVTETALAIQKDRQQLKDLIRASIRQLVEYIFPIIPVQPVPRLEHIFSVLPYHTDAQNIAAKWLAVMLHMQEVLI
jgi:hypothetical protein